jgi:hypothetical protein
VSRLTPQQIKLAAAALGLGKYAAVPVEEIAPQGDPAAAGGAPPMDPAMAGGAPPMDPAMMDPAMMDPAMMDPAMAGGAPPMDPAMAEPDPLIAMIEQMAKDVAQTKSLVATLVDQMGIKIPVKEVLESGEDVVADSAMKASLYTEEGYVPASGHANSQGDAWALPPDAIDYTRKAPSLDATLQYASAVFRSQKG